MMVPRWDWASARVQQALKSTAGTSSHVCDEIQNVSIIHHNTHV